MLEVTLLLAALLLALAVFAALGLTALCLISARAFFADLAAQVNSVHAYFVKLHLAQMAAYVEAMEDTINIRLGLFELKHGANPRAAGRDDEDDEDEEDDDHDPDFGGVD